MDTVRQQLKLCSRQYNLYMKTVVSLQNNLISLTDKTFPGVNELFSSPERADGHQKWVDFVMTFWHCDCICRVSEKAFTERYQKWCKRKGYHYSAEKALDIYAGSCGHFTTLPKNDNTKLLITTAAQQLLAGKMTLAALRAEMARLARQLPEYDTVHAMYGVGEITAAQLYGRDWRCAPFSAPQLHCGICGCRSGCKPVWQACGAKHTYDQTRLPASTENAVPNRLYISEKSSRGRTGVPVPR